MKTDSPSYLPQQAPGNTPDRSKAPETRTAMPLPLPPVDKTVLDNGITLVTLNRPDLEIARFSIFTTGGYAETPSHAVADVLAELRTEGIPGAGAARIAGIVDFSGSWMSNAPGTHHTSLTLFALDKKAHMVLPLAADMIFRPTFPEAELDTTVRRLAARGEVKYATAPVRASMASDRLTFGENHPLADNVTPDSIRAVTRQNLVDFHSRFTDPANVTIFVAGPASPDRMDYLNRVFGSVRPDNPVPFPGLSLKPFSPAAPGTVATVTVADAPQSAIVMTVPAIPRTHPDYLALRLTAMALGGYFGSRLSQNIREDKGYTYGVSAALLGFKEGSAVKIATQCDTAYTPAVLDQIALEMRRLATEPLRPDELQRLKQTEITSLIDISDSPFSVIDFYQTMAVAGLPDDYFQRRLNAVETITPETIAEMAAKYLDPDRVLTAIAGPKA